MKISKEDLSFFETKIEYFASQIVADIVHKGADVSDQSAFDAETAAQIWGIEHEAVFAKSIQTYIKNEMIAFFDEHPEQNTFYTDIAIAFTCLAAAHIGKEATLQKLGWHTDLPKSPYKYSVEMLTTLARSEGRRFGFTMVEEVVHDSPWKLGIDTPTKFEQERQALKWGPLCEKAYQSARKLCTCGTFWVDYASDIVRLCMKDEDTIRAIVSTHREYELLGKKEALEYLGFEFSKNKEVL